ncbi:hypothetical protein SISNIDRAFT_469673 [Sistotremastrum niveocremeum HHB9708]|uniref:DUF6535 domain-containing protein n=1 Tax=Sistotremastrum niveocremeum HHB9708 TaxID=1314777 RepID=A0A164PRB6_9AGAM|nr:hypothetical protein SISNIDRAFT_469673 [Sistotremastrum niveocremeum HHB9708]
MSTSEPAPDLENPVAGSTSQALKSGPDFFNTPLFNRLIGLIQEQNAASSEQRKASQETNATLLEHQKILEEQREIMREMKRALDGRGISAEGTCVVLEEHSRANHDPQRPDIQAHPAVVDAPTTSVSTAHPESGRIEKAIMVLHDTMTSVKEVLVEHGAKLSELVRNARKDEEPYDEKALEDESTCAALFEMAMAKTKEKVDEWIKRLDVSLVFIALFSAILTAFLIPSIQNLFPVSNDTPASVNSPDSLPPLPPIPVQDVCILFYLALILSILDAVLSVLGRQWMSKLITPPNAKTYRERLLLHRARENTTLPWLAILVEGLHILLLSSIALFVTGLLYQLWNLSVSFERRATRLVVTWAVGVILSTSIIAVVIAVTIHAICHEASPFEGPVSIWLFKLIGPMSTIYPRVVNGVRRYHLFSEWMILNVITPALATPLWLSSLVIEKRSHHWDKSDPGKRLLEIYMALVTTAHDPKLLERVVGSFSYIAWERNTVQLENKAKEGWERTPEHPEAVEEWQTHFTQLKSTWARLMETDVSARVRRSLITRINPFVKHLYLNKSSLPPELYSFFEDKYSTRDRFLVEVYFTSYEPDNQDLRPFSVLSLEESVARVLCACNHRGVLGERRFIWDKARSIFEDILNEENEAGLNRILSYVTRLDLIKSRIQCVADFNPGFVDPIVRNHEHEILVGINDFIGEVAFEEHTRFHLESFYEVIRILATPPPTDVDLSATIGFLSRAPASHYWQKLSDVILAYFNVFYPARLSDQSAISKPGCGYDRLHIRSFLQRCIAVTPSRTSYLYISSNNTYLQAAALWNHLFPWETPAPSNPLLYMQMIPASNFYHPPLPSGYSPLQYNNNNYAPPAPFAYSTRMPPQMNADASVMQSPGAYTDIPMTSISYAPQAGLPTTSTMANFPQPPLDPVSQHMNQAETMVLPASVQMPVPASSGYPVLPPNPE